jgi:GNAT superfamily N-acetyltransferase
VSHIIRPATLDDARGIAGVMAAVWPDEAVDESLIGAAIAHPGHAAFVAAAPDGRTLAFADGFTTGLPDGRLRWELDLLGTLPEARGRGLGTELIRACTAAGWQRGAAFARALIRLGNAASERAFGRAGYTAEGPELSLYVQSEDRDRAPAGMRPVPVTTMRYEGIWLEGPIGRPKPVAGRERRRSQVIGVLVQSDNAAARESVLMCNFLPAGDFRWWHATPG